VERSAQLLAQLGHRVEPARVAALDAPQIGPWIAAAVARELDRWSELLGEKIGEGDVEPLNWAMAEQGRAMSAVEYVRQAEAATSWGRALAVHWGRDFDVLLTPTSPAPPPKLGYLAPNVPFAELLGRLGTLTQFTMPFDVTGQPAISLPLHWSADGLPVGAQLAAAYGREDVLIRLASQLEEARPWTTRRPPIHA
jgi:amidase